MRNRFWTFKIEQKIFVLHLTKDGGGVRISERSRLRSFEVEIDVCAAVWCLETLQEVVLSDESKSFFRKYRGSNFSVLAEIYFNRRGEFLKFTKLSKGTLQNIIIPGGLSRWGWRRMAVCLDNLVGKRFWNVKGTFRKGDHQDGNLSVFGKRQNFSLQAKGMQSSWKRIVEGNSKLGEVVEPTVELPSACDPKRNWRVAVLAVRWSAFTPWSRIRTGMTRFFKNFNGLTPYSADRAIIWCNSIEDKFHLEGMGFCNIPGLGKVSFEKWKPVFQFRNLKTVCTNSWIGIEGLPINLWNVHVFKDIGQRCGGLLDIAKCTKDLSFLSYAIVRLRGNKSGFIQEQFEINGWGTKIGLKTFSLKDRNPRFHGVQNFQECGSKVEDDDEVAYRPEKVALKGMYNSEVLSPLTDKGCTQKEGCSAIQVEETCQVKAAALERQFLHPSSSNRERRWSAEKTGLPELTLSNKFKVLEKSCSFDQNRLTLDQIKESGQAQIISVTKQCSVEAHSKRNAKNSSISSLEQLGKRPMVLVDRGKRPMSLTRPSQPILNVSSAGPNCLNSGSKNFNKGHVTSDNRATKHRCSDQLGISNEDGRKAVMISARAISCPDLFKRTPFSPSNLSVKADSSTGYFHSNQCNQRRLCKGVKPKDRGGFKVGRVLSWSEFAPRRKSPRISVSKQSLCLGNSISIQPKTQDTEIYLGCAGKIGGCPTTKTTGNREISKVYSRRPQNKVQNLTNATKDDISQRLDIMDVGHNIEELSSCSSQSITDSSSEYSESDRDLERRQDDLKEYVRESEDRGLEGLKFIMGSQDLSMGGKINVGVDLSEGIIEADCSVKTQDKQKEGSKGPFADEVGIEREEVLGENVHEFTSDICGPDMQVGNIRFSWKEIKEAIGVLNIQLVEKEAVSESEAKQVKRGRSLVRKKRGERELHNLKCTIDYEKGSKEKGLGSDK